MVFGYLNQKQIKPVACGSHIILATWEAEIVRVDV
jgi:hypothetical protein